jgi:hypothetical protein
MSYAIVRPKPSLFDKYRIPGFGKISPKPTNYQMRALCNEQNMRMTRLRSPSHKYRVDRRILDSLFLPLSYRMGLLGGFLGAEQVSTDDTIVVSVRTNHPKTRF